MIHVYGMGNGFPLNSQQAIIWNNTDLDPGQIELAGAIDVWEWISIFIRLFIMDVIICPCWD